MKVTFAFSGKNLLLFDAGNQKKHENHVEDEDDFE